jgi:two-component system response regulator
MYQTCFNRLRLIYQKNMNTTAVKILLVEDNLQDAELAIRALKKSNLANHLLHLEDGQEALDFLFDKKNEMPRLILLDLKMPRVDGLEVLRILKTDEKKRLIPVVMLTSSKEEKDIIESYNLGVNAYIVKPVDCDQFVKAVTQVGLFWLVLNEAPVQT